MLVRGSLSPELLARLGTHLLGLLCLMRLLGAVTSSETVFFNRYGHCARQGRPFDLDDDVYILKSTGGADAYETKVCEMTFKTSSDDGLCLVFNHFQFDRCDVTLKIYDSKTASGKTWETLGCHDQKSGKMCTPNRYVTIVLTKEVLTENSGYIFDIALVKDGDMELLKDAHRTGDSAFDINEHERVHMGKSREKTTGKTSTAVAVVACALGAIVVMAALAAVALHFCKRQRGSIIVGEATLADQKDDHTENIRMASAPPMEDPPPYVHPPPYQEEFPTGSGTDVLYENAPMLNR
ncbi:hypothetical protein RRG08_060655 [Elysia crispata]|uniref:CUB domain-containing protein n=1 Tax=Elysia crispata TaxID=231223 RepID=A0AAE1E484_9GAST|nr:hypothetical protein RRG08_060655 [Elysia crispata]